MNVVQIKNIKELEEILQNNKFIVIKFYADWCGACRHIKGNVEALFSRHPEIKFCEIDCGNSENSDLKNSNFDGLNYIIDLYSIRSVPSFVFIKDIERGRVIQTALIGKIPLIMEKVEEFINLDGFLLKK